MAAPVRISARRLLRVASPFYSRGFTSSCFAAQNEPWPQTLPLGEYYESILRNPPPYPFSEKPEKPPSSAHPAVLTGRTPTSEPAPPTIQNPDRKATATTPNTLPVFYTSSAESSQELTPQQRAAVVFGVRDTGPTTSSIALKASKSTYISGILVPPQPEEPDNCCMSGCVNCVWDMFRDDMEEWSAKNTEAQRRLKDGSGTIQADGGAPGVKTVKGGVAKDLWDDSVFQNVPVGIREFMKQEKRLKEKHARERGE